MHKGERNVTAVNLLQIATSNDRESVLQFPHSPHRTTSCLCFAGFSPYCSVKKTFRNTQYNYSPCCIEIHGRLPARGKYPAAPEVSATGATYACPRVTYIFLRFPQPSRRNLFEFVKTRDGLRRASCVRLGQAGATSALGKSQRGRARRLGLSLRKVCSVREGAVPAPRATVTSRGAPTVHQGPPHSPAHGSWRAWDSRIAEHPRLPQQLLLPRGTVADVAKKIK